jgi:hypothetical protein
MPNTEEPKSTTATAPKKVNKVTPTMAQVLAFNLLLDAIKSGKATVINMGDILEQAGYSPTMANTPKQVTESRGFKQLMEEYYPQDKRIEKHKQLLETVTIDHRTFPVAMTDEEMIALVESVPGCKVKKIMHGEQQNHVWFFIPDGALQLAALDKLYKITGDYSAEKVDVNNSDIDEALKRLEEIMPE